MCSMMMQFFLQNDTTGKKEKALMVFVFARFQGNRVTCQNVGLNSHQNSSLSAKSDLIANKKCVR